MLPKSTTRPLTSGSHCCHPWTTTCTKSWPTRQLSRSLSKLRCKPCSRGWPKSRSVELTIRHTHAQALQLPDFFVCLFQRERTGVLCDEAVALRRAVYDFVHDRVFTMVRTRSAFLAPPFQQLTNSVCVRCPFLFLSYMQSSRGKLLVQRRFMNGLASGGRVPRNFRCPLSKYGLTQNMTYDNCMLTHSVLLLSEHKAVAATSRGPTAIDGVSSNPTSTAVARSLLVAACTASGSSASESRLPIARRQAACSCD